MKKVYILLCGFLLSIGFAHVVMAQTKVEEYVEEFTYSFKHNKAPEKNKPYINGILTALSASTQKPLAAVEYTITFQQKIAVLLTKKEDKEIYSSHIEIKPTKIKGDIVYKNFDLSHYLLPAGISFRCQNTKEPNFLIAKFSEVRPDALSHYIANTTFMDTLKNIKKLRVRLDQVELHYSQVNVDKLKEQLSIIENYYTLASKLPTLKETLFSISFKETENFMKEEQKFKEVKKEVETIKHYHDKLNLGNNDPANIKEDINKMLDVYKTVELAYYESARSMHVLLYQKGLEFLHQNKPISAKHYFLQAAHRNPEYVLPQIQLARLEYLDGEFETAEENLDKIWYKASLTSDSKEAAQAVYTDLFSYYLNQANHEARDLKFDEAIVIYKKAQKLCEKNVVKGSCFSELSDRMRRTKKDKLEYLISNARYALKQNDLPKAQLEVESLIAYQTDNIFDIPERQPVYDICNDFFAEALVMARSHMGRHNYDKALNDLNAAQSMCRSKYNLRLNCDEVAQLIKTAQTGKINIFIQQAQTQAQTGDLQAAHRTLTQAKQYLIAAELPPHQPLDIAYKNLVANFVQKSERLANTAKFEEAVAELNYAKTVANETAEPTSEQEVQSAYQKAYTGKIKNLIILAAKQRNAGELQSAFTNLEEAQKLQNEYGKWIQPLAELEQEKGLLCEAFIQKGEIHLAHNRNEEAVANLDAAHKLKQSATLPIQQKLVSDYCKAYTAWAKHSSAENPTVAAAYLEKANSFQVQNPESILPETKTFYEKSKEEILKGMIASLLKKASSASPDVAASLMTQIADLVEKHQYTLPDELSREYTTLKAKTIKDTCDNIKKAYNEQVAEAQSLAKNHSYAKAILSAEKAVITATKQKECGLTPSAAQKVMEEYGDAAKYDAELSTIETLIQDGRYEEASIRYKNLQKLYADKGVIRFGIKHTPFPDFVAKHPNSAFINYNAIENSQTNLNFTNRLLEELERRNYGENLMLKLGESLAERDFQKNSTQKSTVVITRYSIFANRYFKQGYTERWKTLGD